MQQRWVPSINYNPAHWLAGGARLVWRAIRRLWGRDVMLYTGGVSFFAMLAVFPALAISIGVYSLMLTPEQAATQADAFSQILPSNVQLLFQHELLRLAHAPPRSVSVQSGFAVLIGLYAAHRGIKALIAGLSFIHADDDEAKTHSFVQINILAFLTLLAALFMMSVLSAVFLAVRLMASTLHMYPLRGVSWFDSEWTWAMFGLSLGLTLIYRYAMATRPVPWVAAIIGGVTAAIVSLLASWASAFYVKQFAHFGATYGSIAAVVVMLIWLSWTVNSIFFGAALATELEQADLTTYIRWKGLRWLGVRRQPSEL
jgi:membrane protein